MKCIVRSKSVFAAAPLMLALFAAQPAAAQNSDVIQGCAGKTAGLLRFLEPGGSCRSGETALSWNVQGPTGPAGPAGPQGPQGPAGPGLSISAVVSPDGSFQVLNLAPGSSLTVTRTGVGAWNMQVSGLGNACPLPTANAFANVTMWFGSGSCSGGSVSLPIFAGNGVDTFFILSVFGNVNPGLAKGLPRSQAPQRLGND